MLKDSHPRPLFLLMRGGCSARSTVRNALSLRGHQSELHSDPRDKAGLGRLMPYSSHDWPRKASSQQIFGKDTKYDRAAKLTLRSWRPGQLSLQLPSTTSVEYSPKCRFPSAGLVWDKWAHEGRRPLCPKHHARRVCASHSPAHGLVPQHRYFPAFEKQEGLYF